MVAKVFFWLLGIAALALVAYCVTMLVILVHTAQMFWAPSTWSPITTPAAPPPTPGPRTVATPPTVYLRPLLIPADFRGLFLVHYRSPKASPDAPGGIADRLASQGLVLTDYAKDEYEFRFAAASPPTAIEVPILLSKRLASGEEVCIYAVGPESQTPAAQAHAAAELQRYMNELYPATFTLRRQVP